MTPTVDVTIGIATAGRRDQMPLTLAQVALLNPLPKRVIVCPATDKDFDPNGLAHLPFEVQVVSGPKGLPNQRNTILDHAGNAGLILFIDDDFYPATDYLAQLQQAFGSTPNMVCASNQPVADGINGPGYTHEQAQAILASSRPVSQPSGSSTYGGYGCNMTFRLDVIQQHGLRFDGALPLYGWLEDIEFSRRMAHHGAIMYWSGLRGVHLATKQGRTSGVRFGYSQIANPYYMWRKGSMSGQYAFNHVWKNVAMNVVRSFWPEPWVDRKGRLKGNALAVIDLVAGRVHPGKILSL